MPIRKAVSPALFAVVVICFFLPFFTVACTAGEELAGLGEQFGGDFQLPPSDDLEVSVTGFDIVIGSDGEEGSVGETEQQPADARDGGGGAAQIFAVVALALAVLGIGLSLLRGDLGPILAAALGLAAAIALFLLRNELTGQIPPQAAAFIEVQTEYGFWLALLFSLAAAGWGVFRLVTERGTTPRPAAGPTGFETPTTTPRAPEPPPP